MDSAKLLKVKQVDSALLMFVWSDGREDIIRLQSIRDSCPCAACQGETVLFQTYTPQEPKRDTPGRYDLKHAETVGVYALQLTWGDGHNTGIYTWEHLRELADSEDRPIKKG